MTGIYDDGATYDPDPDAQPATDTPADPSQILRQERFYVRTRLPYQSSRTACQPRLT